MGRRTGNAEPVDELPDRSELLGEGLRARGLCLGRDRWNRPPALAVIAGATSSASIAVRMSSLSVWARSAAASFQRFCSLAVIGMWMYVLRRATSLTVITRAAVPDHPP
jgi:hypothetical protein